MDYISTLFTLHSAVQTVVIVSLIIAIGLAFGTIKIKGISLGIAGCSSSASSPVSCI